MRAIRVIALGLVIAAYLMHVYAIDFYKWQMNESAPFLFLAAINAISPSMLAVGGMDAIFPAAYILACTGAGLFLSSTGYTVIDLALGRLQSLPALRKKRSVKVIAQETGNG